MTPASYAERVTAHLDIMGHEAKDAIIWGFLSALYPLGDPDHPVGGADFIAEAIRLLTEFHPNHLRLPTELADLDGDPMAAEF